jgi:HSP20 family protein
MPGFFFDDFFGRDWFNDEMQNSTLPAVNIHEDGNEYHVELAAPGMKKKDFNVELEDQMLKISYEKKEENEEKNKDGKYTKREFNYTSFERSFMLPKSVEQEKIKGEYKDGILTLRIPKKEEAKNKPARMIEIS